MLKLRNIFRYFGLNALVNRMLDFSGNEAKFIDAIKRKISSKCVVWDVGANRGLIVEELLGIDEHFTLVAFEPVCENYIILENKFSDKRLILKHCALSNVEGVFSMELGPEADLVTSRLTEHQEGNERVFVTSPEKFILQNKALRPDVVKIDVEGYEVEILDNLLQLIKSDRLHKVCIFCEVHFAIISQRGLNKKFTQLIDAFKLLNYKIRWIDASHFSLTHA